MAIIVLLTIIIILDAFSYHGALIKEKKDKQSPSNLMFNDWLDLYF